MLNQNLPNIFAKLERGTPLTHVEVRILETATKGGSQRTWLDRYEHLQSLTFEPECALLHDHIGGSVDLRTVRNLALLTGMKDVGPSYFDFKNSIGLNGGEITDLNHYLRAYDRIEALQAGPEAFHAAVKLAIDSLFSFGGHIPYSDPLSDEREDNGLHITTPRFIELRGNHLKRTRAELKGTQIVGFHDIDIIFMRGANALEEAQENIRKKVPGFAAGFVACFGKDLSFEDNLVYAEKVRRHTTEGRHICGLDIAGPELDPERTKLDLRTEEGRRQLLELFEAAGKHLPRTIHLGETDATTIEAFTKTLELVTPQRVSHPLTAVFAYLRDNDDRGMRLMQELGLVAEILPRSNELSHRVKTVQEFADILEAFERFEIPTVIGADASGLHNQSWATGVANLLLSGAATLAQINQMIRNSIEATFVNPNRSLALVR